MPKNIIVYCADADEWEKRGQLPHTQTMTGLFRSLHLGVGCKSFSTFPCPPASKIPLVENMPLTARFGGWVTWSGRNCRMFVGGD